MGMSFTTLLIANRGEIAVRIMQTASRMGYRTVAVYSEADADALHVRTADLAVCLGPAPVAQSYLDPERVLAAIARSGADAVHPGYGFLSENAAFARAVQAAGAVWIGPPPDAIEAMGDKASAKALMLKAGVPCVPGFTADHPTDAALIEAAAGVGFPLLVKASAGGGGRGMRRVYRADELPAALRSARAEARNAFGDDGLILERLVEGARHVEIQVIADEHGNIVHLNERDCSVQRRHQKVIEEAPSPAVDPVLRSRMGEAACQAARAVGYTGAGTVEFLLDGQEFYFLEMNTRLQVEHPVTEAITGLDLVELQLQVAAGEPLGFVQQDVALDGHAIEVRLYAEDPAQGFLPQPGPIHAWCPAENVRVDHGLNPVDRISSHYDPMVAKLIGSGRTREQARRNVLRGLEQTVFFGVTTNRDLLARLLSDPVFIAGAATTDWLDGTPALVGPSEPDPDVRIAALALWRGPTTPLRSAHVYDQPFVVEVDGEPVSGAWTPTGLRFGTTTHEVRAHEHRDTVDGLTRAFQVHREGSVLFVRHGTTEHVLRPFSTARVAIEPGQDGRITMPMSGQVLGIDVKPGDRVEPGRVVAIGEAMKLETRLVARVAGIVEEVAAQVGQALPGGALVVRILTDDASEGQT